MAPVVAQSHAKLYDRIMQAVHSGGRGLFRAGPLHHVGQHEVPNLLIGEARNQILPFGRAQSVDIDGRSGLRLRYNDLRNGHLRKGRKSELQQCHG